MKTAAGIRNKNYLNVKGRGWKGQVGSDSRGHAIFETPEYGIRAGILNLRTYFLKHKLRTVAEILSRWAPATDTVGSIPGAPPNSPKEYTNFVTKRMDVGPNQKLDLFHSDGRIANLQQLQNLFLSMSVYETGGGYSFPDDEFKRAIRMV